MFSISFQCKRSISISKPMADVRSVVGDFSLWGHWSPWLCMEKDCQFSTEGEPRQPSHRQDWDGQRIGSGNMVMTSQTETSFVYDLTFLKPWKSKSTVEFSFNEQEGETEVTWIMNGSLPFFMFFMKKMMIAWVESDFDRGLLMLKDYIEQGQVLSDTEVTGTRQKQGFFYLGIDKESSIADMPEIMAKDFSQLMEWVEASDIAAPKEVISFYHKYDLVNGRCKFTSALLYDEEPENTKDLASGQVPDHQVVQVVHTGPYKYLGNAWSTVMAEQRTKKLKMDKQLSWYELYINDPSETPEADLKTEINIPIKN